MKYLDEMDDAAESGRLALEIAVMGIGALIGSGLGIVAFGLFVGWATS